MLLQYSVPGQMGPADRASLKMQPFAEMSSLLMSLPDCSVLTGLERWPSLQKLNFSLLRLILGLHTSVVVLGVVLMCYGSLFSEEPPCSACPRWKAFACAHQRRGMRCLQWSARSG